MRPHLSHGVIAVLLLEDPAFAVIAKEELSAESVLMTALRSHPDGAVDG